MNSDSLTTARKAVQPYWLTGGMILLTAFFLISSLRFYEHVPVASWGDTNTYHSMSRADLTDPDLWTGRYPMTTALFHKVCSADPGCIADVQVWLAIVSWLWLGVAVVALIENRPLKLIAFAVILGLGLTTGIISMNKVLLSETYSNSLFVLMTAAMLLFGKWLRVHPNWRAGRQILLVVLGLLPIVFLWSFTRDPNAWYLLALAGLLMLAAILWRKSLRSWLPAIGIFVIGAILLFIFQNYTVNRSQRGLQPFPSHIFINVLPYPERTEFFADHGMPTHDAVMAMSGQFVGLDDWPTDFEQWFYADGRRTYVLYLASFPKVTLTAPLENWEPLLVESPYRLAKTFDLPPTRQQQMDELFYHLSGFWLLAVIIATLALFGFAARHRRWQWFWFLPLVMLLMVYPIMFMIWHGSPTEIPRLAVGLNLQLRLGGWLLLIFAADATLKLRAEGPQTSKFGRSLAIIILPLLILELIFRVPVVRNEVLLPLTIDLAPKTNLLEPWGVSELQHQLFVDDVPRKIASDAVLVSPGSDAEGLTTVIDADGWRFTPERGVVDVNLRRALMQWRETASPSFLKPLGAAYVYLDSSWWAVASSSQRAMIENSALYELLDEWTEPSGAFRRLYRVVSFGGGAVVNEDTLGLSEENFAGYQTYVAENPLFMTDDVIFNPATGLDWFDSSAALGNLIQTQALDDDALHSLFDLMQTWQRVSYEDDLDLNAEERAALDAWRASKMPGHLRAAGIDYLFYSDLWQGYLTQEEYDRLFFAGLYETVAEWTAGIPGRYMLLRPISNATE